MPTTRGPYSEHHADIHLLPLRTNHGRERLASPPPAGVLETRPLLPGRQKGARHPAKRPHQKAHGLHAATSILSSRLRCSGHREAHPVPAGSGRLQKAPSMLTGTSTSAVSPTASSPHPRRLLPKRTFLNSCSVKSFNIFSSRFLAWYYNNVLSQWFFKVLGP